MPRLNALRADHHLANTPFVERPHTLKVGVETPLGNIVSVADIASHHRLFSAQITHLGHDP
jgi:hypothetical protein